MHSATRATDLPPEHRVGDDAAAISEAVVRLLRLSTGRGPTRASTVISSDLAVITLEDCLTKAEKTLAAQGRRALADGMRAAVHDLIRTEAVARVEEVTGRQVVAYLAAQEYEPDVAVIAFYFGKVSR